MGFNLFNQGEVEKEMSGGAMFGYALIGFIVVVVIVFVIFVASKFIKGDDAKEVKQTQVEQSVDIDVNESE